MLHKIALAAVLAVASIGATATTSSAGFFRPAYAQTEKPNVSERMKQMKLSHPRAYNDCLNLAVARGHSRGYEDDTNLMMFVEGCIAHTQL
jgi:hypothetical protein